MEFEKCSDVELGGEDFQFVEIVEGSNRRIWCWSEVFSSLCSSDIRLNPFQPVASQD
jgi:hypothetical protein